MSYIVILVCGAFVIYMLYNIFMLSKRNKKNKRLIALFDYFENEDVYFKTCDEFINGINDDEFKVKGYVLKLWGACFYKHYEMIDDILNNIDINKFVYKKSKLDGLEINEDSIFYLCIACNNVLYAYNELEQINKIHEFINKYDDILKDQLVYAIGEQNYHFYMNIDDRGKTFYEKVLNGEYSEYKYSRQLILLFKNICTTHLASLYLSENNNEKYLELENDLREFNNSKLGKRYIAELNIELKKEESEESNA